MSGPTKWCVSSLQAFELSLHKTLTPGTLRKVAFRIDCDSHPDLTSCFASGPTLEPGDLFIVIGGNKRPFSAWFQILTARHGLINCHCFYINRDSEILAE